MLLQETASLEDFIVRILADNPGLSVKGLRLRLEAEYRAYSHQAVYKELKKLQEQGIVVKLSRELYLSLPWIFNVLSAADRMYESHLESPALSSLLPAEGERRKWKFSSLLRLDDFWLHLLIALFHSSKSKIMYQWHPHAWFALVHDYKADLLYNACRLGGYKLYRIIGGENFLDKQAAEGAPEEYVIHSFREGPFEGEREVHYCLIDDSLLTVNLGPKLAGLIGSYYERVRSSEGAEIAGVLQFLSGKSDVTITLDRREGKAKKIRRAFTEYFGH